MMTLRQFNAALKVGAYAWPGGYPLFFLMADGEALSFSAAQDNAAEIRDSIRRGFRDGWRPVACDVNWEDAEMRCAHTGARIDAAYLQSE